MKPTATSTDTPTSPFLKPPQAAEFLGGISIVTLARWRSTGQGPRFRKLGPGRNAPVVYALDDLIAFAEAHSFVSTSEYDLSHKGR